MRLFFFLLVNFCPSRDVPRSFSQMVRPSACSAIPRPQMSTHALSFARNIAQACTHNYCQCGMQVTSAFQFPRFRPKPLRTTPPLNTMVSSLSSHSLRYLRSLVLLATSICCLTFSRACRPSSGAAVGFLYSLGGANWKSSSGWLTSLTRANPRIEFIGLKQLLCVDFPPCNSHNFSFLACIQVLNAGKRLASFQGSRC
jgi:hypothetical protein